VNENDRRAIPLFERVGLLNDRQMAAGHGSQQIRTSRRMFKAA
jgi:hypothetical protein